MDAFFVSVELVDRPELRGKPVVVGGGTRGVVSAASYEAREYGVHSAMPMTRARRLCPQAIVLSPDHEKYARVSGAVMEIFRSITPLVEPLALDEAFLDVSGALRRLRRRPAAIGQMIREQVDGQLGITCSVGIASTKFVAKLASTRCKPDGLQVVPEAEVIQYLHALPLAALWGVGERTEAALTRLGLRTVGDLAHTPGETLRRELGTAAGKHLRDLAWGRDERAVVPASRDKSIGAEETFDHDISDPEIIRRELLRLAERVGARLRASGLVGRTVAVKLRRDDFTTITRSRTLSAPTDLAREIHATACSLYAAAGLDGVRLRLVGVRAENLGPASVTPHQMTLGEPETGWREAERAIDQVSRKFGQGTVRPAALLRHNPETRRDADDTVPGA